MFPFSRNIRVNIVSAGNEIDVDESRKRACEEIERRCGALESSGCRYGLDKWVDSAGCTACRCHEPCLTSPPDCPPAHSCEVQLVSNLQTGYPEYRGVCAPGKCQAISN